MFIILSGLPGVGKTTIARELARQTGAMHVRIDSIEQAIREFGISRLDDLGYRAGYAVAEDNLRLGRTVIADSVNPLAITRAAWRDVARRAGVPVVDVEIVCSDAQEHRRRVEHRTADIAGHRQPGWDEVAAREYHPWDCDHVVIDTARDSIEECVADVITKIAKKRR